MKGLIFFSFLTLMIFTSCKRVYYDLGQEFSIIYHSSTNDYVFTYRNEGLVKNVTKFYADDSNIILQLSTYEYVLVNRVVVINNYGKNYKEMKSGMKTYGDLNKIEVELGYTEKIELKKI